MFGFGKKKEKAASSCCCGGDCSADAIKKAEQTKSTPGVKVLGGGCSKCHELQSNTQAALNESGIDLPVELITDFAVIAAYGVMSTPALVINEKVVSYGKVLKCDEIKSILQDCEL